MGGLLSKDKHGNHHKKPVAKAPKVPVAEMSTKDQAVLKLKVTRDRLEKAKKKSETERDLYIEKAKALLKAGKKDQAKLALRTKRYKEKHLQNLDSQLFNLVKMVNDVEWAESQVEVVEGLKAGTAALKQLNALMPVEEVERIMDDNAEAMAEQEEINNILAEGLSDTDEMEALAEYEALLKDDDATKTPALNLPDVPDNEKTDLPDVPSNQPVESGEKQLEEKTAVMN
mmetsp:Transcript_5479/g.6377  ORF Transcript_5479/g.6377 Transcript_5479/m.6377 type:complete len:229 (+) Transcript_5479:81-767(+)|eukprot:CAMPEP_0184016114 /NCGR_PEP_ID=MMETSP0954-20121128/6739_1 /TAXON_ID=627963 /ORGANISM="Aplanochytrium sp, Strain PBS07" /LENGTH=228 /DNA_ID=CAMNT_0026297079 /DNA_START=249 /DNA_END=935 /DNA_ORIENTATION=-